MYFRYFGIKIRSNISKEILAEIPAKNYYPIIHAVLIISHLRHLADVLQTCFPYFWTSILDKIQINQII